MPPPPRSAEALPEDRERAPRAPSDRGGLAGDHPARLRGLPAHGNRTPHADPLFLGLPCAFFDPMARAPRTVESHGDFGGRPDLPRLARRGAVAHSRSCSTTADASAVFDPSCLKPVIDGPRERVPHLPHADADPSAITRRIIAADGTHLDTPADVARAGPQR